MWSQHCAFLPLSPSCQTIQTACLFFPGGTNDSLKRTSFLGKKNSFVVNSGILQIAYCMHIDSEQNFFSNCSHLSSVALISLLERRLLARCIPKALHSSQSHGRGNFLCVSSWFLHFVQMSCAGSAVERLRSIVKMCPTTNYKHVRLANAG